MAVGVDHQLGAAQPSGMKDRGARNLAFARRLASGIGLPLKPFVCGGVCLGSMTGWITNHQSGSAITVEFPANPWQSWLTSRTPPAIISAFGGHYGTSDRHNPLLQVDSATARGSVVSIAGWTFDPDTRAKSIGVYILEGRTRVAARTASDSRPDANRAHHLTNGQGFHASFTATYGRHTYCVQANNILYGNLSPRTCKTVAVNGDSFGSFDTATTQPGSVTVTGWAYDPDGGTVSSSIQVREGSTVIGTYLANQPSPGPNSQHHLTGAHGFTATFAAPAGTHTYTLYAVNLGSTRATAFIRLGAKTVTVATPAAAPPAGHRPAAPKSPSPTTSRRPPPPSATASTPASTAPSA